MDSTYDPLFDAAGQKYNVDPRLLKTVFMDEGGNPNSGPSPAGALGGMQLMPGTAAGLGVDPNNFPQAVDGAARYLAQGLAATGTPEGALAYYHGGPNRALWGPKTTAYVANGEQIYPSVTVVSGATQAAVPAAPAPADPDVATGAALFQRLTGTPPAANSNAAPPAADPDVAAGQALFQRLTAPITPPAPPESTTARAADDEPGAGDETASETAADAATTGAFETGVMHGARVLSTGLNKLLAWGDAEVPALGHLDAATGGSPQAAVNRLTAANSNYDPTYGGNPGLAAFGTAGSLAAQTALTAPVLGPVAGMAGDAAGLYGNALLGGAGRFIAGRAAQGATYGAGFNAATGGNPLTGAAMGAGAGLALPVAAAAAGGLLNVGRAGVGLIGRGVNALTGSTESDIDAALASRYAPQPGAAAAPAAAAVAPAAAPVSAIDAATAAGRPLTTPDGGPTEDAAPWNPANPPAATDGPLEDVLAKLRSGPAGAQAAGTPQQAAAAQATAETQRLLTPPPAGFNPTVYVPGTTPTLAETTGDTQIALAQKQAFAKNGAPFVAQEQANNTARQDYFAQLAGTPSTVQTMEAQRDAQATADLAQAWQAKQPADATPVVQQIQGILASPIGKLPPVQDAMNKALQPLYDAQGNLETDPEMLYGARQNITYLMSKTAQLEKPGLKQATAQLAQVKNALDGVIEQGAPGYQQYLSNYSAASKPIDAQTVLQGYQPGLQGADGTITLNRVQSMLKQVVQQRQLPGVNPAKSIDPDTMNGLFNLRDDLLRKANLGLGKVAGSDTAQNLDMAGQLGMHAVNVATSHVPLAGPAINHLASIARGKTLNSLTNRLLDGSTPPGGYSPP